MSRLILVAVIALAGCDQVFNLTRPLDARVDDAPIDVVDALPLVCDFGAPAPSIPIPSKGTAIAAGKFDDDDAVDLVIGTTASNDLLFRFNAGGDFSGSRTEPVGGAVLDLVAGRIDSDGLDDIAFITATTANAMLRTVTSWDRRMITIIAGPPQSIALANFDGVELADMMVTAPSQQLIHLYSGGALTYMAGAVPTTGASVVSAVSVDIDGDGQPDIVGAVENQNGIQIYMDTGSEFTASPVIPTGTKPNAVAAGLLGNRTVVDFVVVNHDSQTITIVRNDGGTFSTTSSIDVGESPRGLVLADVDADQFTDILLLSNTTNRLHLIKGTATGFEARRDYTTVAKPTALAVADFNGDDRLDVAVLSEDDGFVIHETECRTP